MAGKIIADQIEHSTAGSLDTSYVVDGSSKAWYNLNGAGTIALRDSLNITSASDDGVGIYSVSFSSNMSAANYGITTASSYLLTSFVGNTCAPTNTYSTSGFGIENLNTTHASYLDYEYVFADIKGDLA